jgi:cobalt-precorrin-5B (C1)-methyltransferase
VGEKFLTSRFGISKDRIVAVGDHIGHALDTCVEAGLKKITLCGHIGKWSKLAAGLFNTHYSTGDARLETIAALAGASGATAGTIQEILDLELAEACIDIIRREDLMGTFDIMAQRIHKRCTARTEQTMEIGVIALSLKGDILGAFPDNLGEEDIWQRFISQE